MVAATFFCQFPAPAGKYPVRGDVLTREQIPQRVWKEQPFITVRTVDVHVAWLRQKLEANTQSPRHILTVRGEDCRFEK
jgi:DNA-binding response OmpR family regulator